MPIENYIDNMNISINEWEKEDPDNRFAVKLSKDVNYWKQRGIKTVPQLKNYMSMESGDSMFNINNIQGMLWV